MQFVIDNNNQAAETLGIKVSHGTPTGLQVFGYDSDTVLPTVIITDEENQVIYSDLSTNYRVRPHPDDFTEVIRGNQ